MLAIVVIVLAQACSLRHMIRLDGAINTEIYDPCSTAERPLILLIFSLAWGVNPQTALIMLLLIRWQAVIGGINSGPYQDYCLKAAFLIYCD